MKLTTRSKYAIVALKRMKDTRKGPDDVIKLADLSEGIGISLHYLEQIFVNLRRAEIVESVRGPGGGYKIIKSNINYRMVFKAVGEKIDFTDGVNKNSEVFDMLESIERITWNNLKHALI